MKIAISGSHGLIGGALAAFFKKRGDEIISIVRNKDAQADHSCIHLDLNQGHIEIEKLEGVDVIIHLSGANIAAKRWTSRYKEEILTSRVKSTEILSQAILNLKNPPKVFICASAIGYYGNHDANITIDEASNQGKGFLADVCRKWEEAAQPVAQRNIRSVSLRFAAVLSKQGGALAKMLPPFQLGLGGRIGSGDQMFSWISLKEIPQIVSFILENDQISGPVNCVSPCAVTNKNFTKVLATMLKRPAFLPMPAVAVKLLFGEMGKELLLEGAKVYPKVLERHGYQFVTPTLESALGQILKRY